MQINDGLLYAIAVAALGIFLCLTPFKVIPPGNEKLALAVISGLLGFLGGVAVGKLGDKSSPAPADAAPLA